MFEWQEKNKTMTRISISLFTWWLARIIHHYKDWLAIKTEFCKLYKIDFKLTIPNFENRLLLSSCICCVAKVLNWKSAKPIRILYRQLPTPCSCIKQKAWIIRVSLVNYSIKMVSSNEATKQKDNQNLFSQPYRCRIAIDARKTE